MSQTKPNGLRGWYESYSGKKVVNMVYCLGASVVIIGALFKIMHLPGAGPMLFAGMCTEAVLFAIGCFDRPHVDFHWEQVFPQLMGYGADPELLEELSKRPKPTLLGGGSEGGSNAGGTSKTDVPALSESDMEALKGGITNLAKTAVQLTELGKVATNTTQLADKMDAATKAVDQFAGSQVQLAQNAERLNGKYQQLGGTYDTMQQESEKAVELTRVQQKSIEGLNSQLGSINAVYELQLNTLKSQADIVKGQSESIKANNARIDAVANDMQKLQTAMADAAANAVAYEDGAKKLASQIADLNKIYGNMLNALA